MYIQTFKIYGLRSFKAKCVFSIYVIERKYFYLNNYFGALRIYIFLWSPAAVFS